MKNPLTKNLWLRSPAACIKINQWSSQRLAVLVCVAMCACSMVAAAAESRKSNAYAPAREAPSGFDNLSNGFEEQQAFDKDRATFDEVESILPEKGASEIASNVVVSAKPRNHPLQAAGSSSSDEGSSGGLGPVYNATSCASCHQNPVSGSSSQISELRAGHNERRKFVEHPGGSLVHQRAIDPLIQEHVVAADRIRSLRMSTSVLGSGFIEMIPDEEIRRIQKTQLRGLQGTIAIVPVAVKGKKTGEDQFQFEFVERAGRFGWKCQEASLINFSAGAYLNEMGITSPLNPDENSSDGNSVAQFDKVKDPEDKVDASDPDNTGHPFGDDVKAFARFMRSTKVPPRGHSVVDAELVQKGERIFRDLDLDIPNRKKLGCAVCHRPDYTTPKVGTQIRPFNDDAKAASDLETVPEALAGKMIHPFSDFMLHDIGTGDGIVQTQHAQRPPRGMRRANLLRADLLGASLPGEPVAPAPKIAAAEGVKVDDGQITANMIRTAPLWGLRVRPQMLHDGRALTVEEAIRAHKVKGCDGKTKVDLPRNYDKLTPDKKTALQAFLNSL